MSVLLFRVMQKVPQTLIIGANSFIGCKLLAAYRCLYPGTLGTTRRRDGAAELAYLDLEHPDLDALPLHEGDYRAAIIAAAISRVVPCEADPEGTRRINVTATLRLIDQLRARDILPIFLSTDYVFDGAWPHGYADDAPLCPCTEYGRHKAAVEEALAKSGLPYLVLRLSKVYGLERDDHSLLDEMAGQLSAGKVYAAATDQIFCPSYVNDLPGAIMEVQSLGLTGVLNFCAAQPWSRYHLALAIARHLRLPETLVRPVSLDDLPGAYRRPRCTVLSPLRLARETSIRFTTVEEALPVLARAYGPAVRHDL